MRGAPEPNVLVDMDSPGLPIKPGAKCDFLFVGGDDHWVVPLELKSGSLDASQTLRQLQAGARFAKRLVPKSTATRFLPIAVVGGKIHRDERRRLRDKCSWVSFRGKRTAVGVMKCGQSLAETLRRISGG